MATQVASLFGLLEIDDSDWTRKLQNANQGIANLGSSLQNIGRNMTLATAPIAAGLGASVMSAMNFESAMTNAGAVLGLSADEMQGLNAQVLRIGRNSRKGPQAAAEAFYDIVGGVADASTHMAILEAAIATSEAGNADLAGTTQALISVMNSYGYSAQDASYVSDVLTRTVGVGVGPMDEFGGALGQTAGLASSVGISFDDLGAMMGYMTTQGVSASQAGTQLTAMMTALLNPNERMKAALAELGVESGTAAIQMYGLDGVFRELNQRSPTFQSGMAGALGSVEALRGVTAMGSDSAVAAMDAFAQSLEGATDAAREIQRQSLEAHLALLRSQIDGVSITIGNVLIPAFNDVVKAILPVVDQLAVWMTQNPEATRGLVLLAGAAAVAGPILFILGTAIKGITMAVGLLLSPLGMTAIAIGGILWAANEGYPGGLIALFNDASVAARQLAVIGLAVLTRASQVARLAVLGVVTILQRALGEINTFISRVGEALSVYGNLGSQFGTIVNLAQGRSVGEIIGVVGNAIGAQFRADGGDVSAGMPYVVGERGPELFVPRGGGEIVPNEAMGGVRIGNVTIYANDAAGGRAAAQSFEAQLVALRRQRG